MVWKQPSRKNVSSKIDIFVTFFSWRGGGAGGGYNFTKQLFKGAQWSEIMSGGKTIQIFVFIF
jgi:hypothetical protein